MKNRAGFILRQLEKVKVFCVRSVVVNNNGGYLVNGSGNAHNVTSEQPYEAAR